MPQKTTVATFELSAYLHFAVPSSNLLFHFFFSILSWYVLYSFCPYNNQKYQRICSDKYLIHVKLNWQGERRKSKEKGVWTLPTLYVILHSHTAIQPQQPLNNFLRAKLWLSPRYFWILFPFSGGFLPITGSGNLLLWVWKSAALPSSLSITSCEKHLPYHLLYDRYPIIILDSILFFSVYQSYPV